MLDQNTDRMWFVIGALVVGAGIILLANNMVPDMFAKVTGSMKNVVTNNIGMVKKVRVGGENLIPISERYKTFENIDVRYYEYVRTVDLAPIIKEFGLGQRYDLSFTIRSVDTSKNSNIRIYIQNGNSQKHFMMQEGSNNLNSTHAPISETDTEVLIEDIYFIESGQEGIEQSYLSFYGLYGSGNTAVISDLKLVLADDE